MRMLKLSLTEFSLPKFYQLFGISKVKSAAVSAFRSSYRPGDRSFVYTPPEQERVSLQSLEIVTDALLEIMEVTSTLCISAVFFGVQLKSSGPVSGQEKGARVWTSKIRSPFTQRCSKLVFAMFEPRNFSISLLPKSPPGCRRLIDWQMI